MRGLHGKVRFRVQRYRRRQTGLKISYFDLTDQFREGYTSLRLEEFVTYYAGRISYEEVEALLVRSTGAKLLSDQKIQQLVVKKAAALSRMQQAKNARLLQARERPEVRREVDLYAAEAREVVLMEDAIQAKQQKAQRERRRGAAGRQQPCGEAPPPNSKQQKAKKKRVSTDVAMLQKRDGSSTSIFVAASMMRARRSTTWSRPFGPPSWSTTAMPITRRRMLHYYRRWWPSPTARKTFARTWSRSSVVRSR